MLITDIKNCYLCKKPVKIQKDGRRFNIYCFCDLPNYATDLSFPPLNKRKIFRVYSKNDTLDIDDFTFDFVSVSLNFILESNWLNVTDGTYPYLFDGQHNYSIPTSLEEVLNIIQKIRNLQEFK